MRNQSVEAVVGLQSRGSSEDSENSAPSNYFNASMEGVALEAFQCQLLCMQETNIEEANDWNPARHSTASCTATERRELENVRWSSLQRRNEYMAVSFDIAGSSFRSEDSEILALWEEKSEAGLDRLGGRRGKVASTDSGRQKPAGLQSPWRESVSNAVKKIESLSHAMVNNKEKQRTTWPRCSPIHPKAGATLDSPRQSVDKKAGGRSPWRDFKIMTNSSPMRSNESLLHNSPKARYSHAFPCGRTGRRESESCPSPITARKLFCQAVSCELQYGSSAAARPVDFNSRRKDDEGEECSLRGDANQENGLLMNGNEFESSCVQPLNQAKCSSTHGDLSKPADSVLGAIETSTNTAQETPPRAIPPSAFISKDVNGAPRRIAAAAERALSPQSTKLNVKAVEGALSPRTSKTIVEAGEKALSRQRTKLSLKAMSESTERCSAQSMDEALLNEYASEAGGQQSRAGTLTSQEACERKASHRYYQKVTSEERSSCWSSSDGNYLDAIDFVAPSAARFLEGSDGCVSPVLAPIKTQGAVPFNWEKEPGKPKKDSESATNQSQSALQLPPRLVVSQQKQDPWSQQASSRNRSIKVALSAPPLADIDVRVPTPKPLSTEAQKVQIPRARSNSERTAQDSSGIGSVKVKSRSVGEVRAALQNLSRQSVGYAGIGDAGNQGLAPRQCTASAPQATQPNHQKPAHISGKVRPASPTSILCGPDDGSRPSSNPSLCSEHEAPLISATLASSLSHCGSPSRASFDSVEHTSEMMSPESNLTSPLRANSRCNSMTYDGSDIASKLRTDRQEESAHSVNALVKIFKNGKRWMKSKSHSKLGTILSPEVWAPGIATRQIQESSAQRGNSRSSAIEDTVSSAGRFLRAQPSMEEHRTTPSCDFSARLEGKPPPLRSVSKIDHSNVQTDCRFAPASPAVLHEDLGNWSPAYAATLELLSPLQELSSKKKKNLQLKSSARSTRTTARRMRVRVRVRARFLVSFLSLVSVL